ncbi:MAG: outer membrane protein transport protein [Pseudomonadales bacterium]
MSVQPLRTAVVLSLYLVVVCHEAHATNGYLSHAIGTRAKGLAGASVASAQGATAIDTATNPALGIFVGEGVESGLGLFSPRRSFSAQGSSLNGQFGSFSLGAGDRKSDGNWFPVPWVATAWPVRNDQGNVAVAFYGRGGMNTEWDAADSQATFDAGSGVQDFSGVYGAGKAGVDLMQAMLSVTYSSMLGSRLSWGIGPQFAVQSFEAVGLGKTTPFTFVPLTRSYVNGAFPEHLSDEGHDFSWGWGISAGLWMQLSERTSFGLAWHSRMRMSRFDRYADLFAEQGGFDIPASLTAGLSVQLADRLSLHLAAEYIDYESVPSVSNSARDLLNCPSAGGNDIEACLGGDRGAGFGWRNMTVYKAGVEWHSQGFGTWRVGYSTAEQPLPKGDALFNILAPGVMEEHWTLGAAFDRANGGRINVAFLYAPSHSIRGPNFLDPTQTIELKMHQYELEFSYAWR